MANDGEAQQFLTPAEMAGHLARFLEEQRKNSEDWELKYPFYTTESFILTVRATPYSNSSLTSVVYVNVAISHDARDPVRYLRESVELAYKRLRQGSGL